MRVKISQTKDLSEIPGLVVQNLQNIVSDLKKLSDSNLNYFSINVLLEQLSEIRYKLSDIDIACEETQGFIAGYSQALQPDKESKDEEPPDEEEEKV